jgi:hypothetical protein
VSKQYDEADEDLPIFIFYFFGAMETLPTYLPTRRKKCKGPKKNPTSKVLAFLLCLIGFS